MARRKYPARGISLLELDLRAPASAAYDVRLHFSEPDHAAPGQRRFDVWIEGRRVLADVDIFAAAGGRHRALVWAFPGTRIDDGKLTVAFGPSEASDGTPASLPLLCGVEVGLQTD